MNHWVRIIHFLAIGALLSLPLMASAEDNTLIQGYCGPMPPNSWFQFSSSTVPAVQSQLISTLTARAFSEYDVAVTRYLADYITPTGCAGQVTPRPSTYCTNPLDCTVQIDGLVQITCGGQSSTPALNTFVIERGGCSAAPGPNPPPKVVVIDPGHGTDCPAADMQSGAIGATDFPLSDPPPGRMREDVLTVTIAQEVQRILSSSNVKVMLTKSDVNTCPNFVQRGRVANDNDAKLLLSIHIDAPNPTALLDMVPSRNGTLAIYHPDKPAAKVLGDKAAADISSRLGLNNRGSIVDTRDLAILKPTVVTPPSVILEIARLSGADEKILHLPTARAAAAAGIKSAVESFLATQP
jgi:N-acetylmuramoyl-L-alanine amidase